MKCHMYMYVHCQWYSVVCEFSVLYEVVQACMYVLHRVCMRLCKHVVHRTYGVHACTYAVCRHVVHAV